MDDNAEGEQAKYWAFISYSHRDAGFGRKLHRWLENYALPARLIGRAAAQGPVPKRLAPIFRDRDEFAAAHNLSSEVRAALKVSRSLVVVCSPSAAASTWVAREIELFRELHPDRPILAALAKGEPSDSFPQALLQSGFDGAPIEPLAADFRASGDGKRPALLKLIAGIIGIGLDELVQRDAQRNFRRVMAVTVGAVAVAILMGLLTIFAFTAQHEAERQRGEAQGLVGFMITDLRDKLKGVGRLDIMSAVNERALEYYDHQEHLSDDSRAHRAQVLLALGDDDETRGDYDKAMTRFQDAYSTTQALLAAAPNNPDRIFDHAQSEFYVGSVYYFSRHQIAPAKEKFLTYKRLTDRLIAMEPKNPKFRKEAAFADGNLCAAELKKPASPPAAIRHCTEALAQMKEVERETGETETMEADIVNRLAWLSDAYRADGDFVRAKSERLIEEEILDRLIAADPKNMDLKDTWIVLQRTLAVIENHDGDKEAARDGLYRALSVANSMHEFDPNNKDWTKDRDFILFDLTKLHLEKDNSHGQQ